MKSTFNEADRKELLTRLDRVSERSHARWGKMNAQLMLAHLVEAMKMPTGELAPRARKLPIRYFPLKQLLIYWLPFPKGAPTAPELLPSDSGTIERSKSELARLIEDFASRSAQMQWPEHPAFGRLTQRAWGVLTWRHMDHHLRQFGA